MKTFKNEENENEKILKSCHFELNDAKKFINKKTLMIKWKVAIFESFDSWTKNLLNRFSVNYFENDLSNENDVEKNAL